MPVAQKSVRAIDLKWRQRFLWNGQILQKVGYKKRMGLAILVKDVETQKIMKFPKSYLVKRA